MDVSSARRGRRPTVDRWALITFHCALALHHRREKKSKIMRMAVSAMSLAMLVSAAGAAMWTTLRSHGHCRQVRAVNWADSPDLRWRRRLA
jgi:hypothetical protein